MAPRLLTRVLQFAQEATVISGSKARKDRRRSSILVVIATGLACLGGTSGFAQTHTMSGGALPHNIPDLCSTPTVSSVAAGAWSNPSTWAGHRVPVANDRVRVDHAVNF